MRRYETVTECLDALSRGMVVDQLDNRVPRRVIEALRRAHDDGNFRKAKKSGAHLTIYAHIRYVGSREVWWFDSNFMT